MCAHRMLPCPAEQLLSICPIPWDWTLNEGAKTSCGKLISVLGNPSTIRYGSGLFAKGDVPHEPGKLEVRDPVRARWLLAGPHHQVGGRAPLPDGGLRLRQRPAWRRPVRPEGGGQHL